MKGKKGKEEEEREQEEKKQTEVRGRVQRMGRREE